MTTKKKVSIVEPSVGSKSLVHLINFGIISKSSRSNAQTIVSSAVIPQSESITALKGGAAMKFAAIVFGCVLGLGSVPWAGAQYLESAHKGPQSSPWWASFEAGAGSITLSSDQQKGGAKTRGAMGIAGGYQPTDRLRVGLHVNGWLFEAFPPYDPIKGESVSNVSGIVDVTPSLKHRLFARGGFGLSTYTNNHVDGFDGSGPCWEAGGGYEIPIGGQLRLAPMGEYSSGKLGNGSPTWPRQTGLRYSVLEFKLSIVGNFGRRR
jgi:hypothetical protein